MAHDFKLFPELTNSQMDFYYFESPHKQIREDFQGEVIRVIDGDTIMIRTTFRDFDFPIRLKDIQTPELKEVGGLESKSHLENEILGQSVDVLINERNRVGKFGRLIGDVQLANQSMSEMMLRDGKANIFGESGW